MKDISSFEERFSALLEWSGKSEAAVAEDLGFSKQAVNFWRHGIRSPRSSAIKKIADYFHVDVVWLMGYDVPQTPGSTIERGEPPDYVPKTREAKILAVGMDKLSPEQRERALKMVQLMFEQADLWEDSDETGSR